MNKFFLKMLNRLIEKNDSELTRSCDWRVVHSKFDPKSPVICKNLKSAEEYINKSEFTDHYIRIYSE